MTTAFETEPCTRCGGTGQHSFNGEHSRCYKCDGKNGCRALTKRGQAAKEFYIARLTVPVTEIEVGQMVFVPNLGKFRVVEIKRKVQNYVYNGVEKSQNAVVIVGKNVSFQTVETATIRLIPTEDENKALIAEALEYQATLTKAGTVRKGR